MAKWIGVIALTGLGLVGVAFTGDDAKVPLDKRKQIKPKVLVINFDPSCGRAPLHEAARWNDPRKLTKEYIADVKKCSGGYVQYQVTEWKDVNNFPVLKDGFRYTAKQYMDCLQSGKGWHDPDNVDYVAIIKEFDLAKRVEEREIDEVWLWGGPYFGYWESTMAGKGAYWCNSGPVEGVECPRIFVIMGFNYERGVGEMLEDLGHRTENILAKVFGRWDNLKPMEELNAWERFTLIDKHRPGHAACGNVHYAPNSESDYQWGNQRKVLSSGDDWLHYPRLTGKKRLVNCTEWGNGDCREHHRWWFRHLPRASGRTDGKLNNWWDYVIDFNSYEESR
ncbi:MAG: hypothetical protein AB1696_17395 [Planctomycetota bacterium]